MVNKLTTVATVVHQLLMSLGFFPTIPDPTIKINMNNTERIGSKNASLLRLIISTSLSCQKLYFVSTVHKHCDGVRDKFISLFFAL